MATIKVVPLSSLGLSNPLLTFGCHVFTHFCETAAMIWHISDTMSQWGICSFFLKKKRTRQRVSVLSHVQNENTLPFTIPKKRRLRPYQQAAGFFFIIIPFSTHCLVTCLCQTFALAIRHYPIWQLLIVSHTISSDMIRSCTWAHPGSCFNDAAAAHAVLPGTCSGSERRRHIISLITSSLW